MKRLLLFTLLVCVHAVLTVVSFASLIGIGFMQPDQRPKIQQVIYGSIAFITWQPFLLVTHDKIRIGQQRLFDVFPYPFILLNSASAVGIGYLVYFGIKRIRRNRGLKSG